MCARQSRKVIWDMINILFLTLQLSNVLLLLSFSTRKHLSMAYRVILSNSKPPTIPYGIVACTFSDNLSRNSCMRSSLDGNFFQFAIFIQTIIHLVYPPKFCVTFVFDFSRGDCNTQEKYNWKQWLCKILGDKISALLFM